MCVSSLTVKDQSDSHRNYTCQFVEGNRVRVEDRFTMKGPIVIRLIGPIVQQISLYHKPGDEAVLSCLSSDSCSSVDWSYERNNDRKQEVHEGIVQSSSRSARLSLDRNCSLIINNIAAEDAGRYRCQPEDGGNFEIETSLNLLIISSSPPDVDPTKNEDVTLSCSLLTSKSLDSCPDKSLLWLNESGSVLLDEGDGFKFWGQTGCVSYLTVNLQSSRRFTCQFVEEKTVKIETHYQYEGPPASSPLSFIMSTLKITGLILMVGVTVGIIRTRGRKKPQKDINVRFAADDDAVSFENVGERSALH
ncbi:uncharacterized protein LOC129354501 [Poeciliopsis prolifica]|uniref:uncharacterized protein LOC129354501 n=1 Tax=Poeciliopsis prolifica TaxID=188132 RepID=UPI00241424C7|nr:uncharacterized protein LOC129354501 [Poeciliopsis prolifica]